MEGYQLPAKNTKKRSKGLYITDLSRGSSDASGIHPITSGDFRPSSEKDNQIRDSIKKLTGEYQAVGLIVI